MNDRHPTPRAGSPADGESTSSDPVLERALEGWGRRARGDDAAGRKLAQRVFAASRTSIAARRTASAGSVATPSVVSPHDDGRVGRRGPRPVRASASGMPMMPMPARLALAASLLVALLVPATLDPDVGEARSEDAAVVATTFEAAESLGATSASEPLLLALIEPDTASWEDVAGHESGVDLYAVLESGRAGLDDYLLELDAIFGTLDGAGEEM